ncbi:MAG TPA: hypothetical protein VHO06_04905 [Polyangia bacterium]|nr:hypothetical protein [Polyangia bacterium]
MKPVHANCATIAGIVDEILELELNRVGRPVLKFYLNTTAEFNPGRDIADRQRCIAVGETASQLAKTIRDGAAVRVDGPLLVNSRARRDLYQRIAKISVRSATVIHPAPTARQIFARVLALPELERPHDCPPPKLETYAQNQIHLVGKVIAIENDDGLPRVTVSTRSPFPATHDVVFWGDALEPALCVGATAEVRGLLYHHLENWSDGQVRLLSRVHSESVRVFDGTSFPVASHPTFSRRALAEGAIRLN